VPFESVRSDNSGVTLLAN